MSRLDFGIRRNHVALKILVEIAIGEACREDWGIK
jgi:hypothetical protein